MWWFVVLTTLLLVAFSSTLYLGIRSSLFDRVDAELLARAHALTALCEWEEDVEQVELDVSNSAVATLLAAGPGRGSTVWAWPPGKLLHRAGPNTSDDPPAIRVNPRGESSKFETRNAAGSAYRICTTFATFRHDEPSDTASPVPPEFTVGVSVTTGLSEVHESLLRISYIVLVLASIAFLVVIGFGLFLSKYFVMPLRRLSEAAGRVSDGQEEKMPDRGTGDEVDRLARILDTSFGSLRQSLERQTRFTADAAHELRNPIATIQNAAEIARRRSRPSEEYEAFLADIETTSQRMGRLVEQLLLLARMDTAAARATFQIVDLACVAQAAVRSVAPDLRARVDVQCAREGTVLVKGDAELLQVLTENIIGNALRYSGSNAAVDLSIVAEPGSAWITVRDRGIGIPEDQVSRVFDRFYRGSLANPNQNGAGLGLAIVAAVAELHDATCHIENARPGTRFRVRLPLYSFSLDSA